MDEEAIISANKHYSTVDDQTSSFPNEASQFPIQPQPDWSHDDNDTHGGQTTSRAGSPLPPTETLCSTPTFDQDFAAQTPVSKRRARVPSNAGDLTTMYSASEQRPNTDVGMDGTNDEADPADAEKGVDSVDEDASNTPVYRRWWTSFIRLCKDLKSDWGSAQQEDVTQRQLDDIGFDLALIDKVQGTTGKWSKTKREHNRITSLSGSSTVSIPLSSGAGIHSTATLDTTHSESETENATGTTTGFTTGVSTPSVLEKILGSGINASELRRQLKEWKKKAQRNPNSEEAKLIQEKSNLAHRRTLVLLLVYAFMEYGAPTHRIEEYTVYLFEKLEMDGRVNYMVGCTEISFINPIDPEDPFTKTAYTTLVKAQGLDVGACEDAYHIYKDVTHKRMSVRNATDELQRMVNGKSQTYSAKIIIPCYGVASALACVWAYGGWWMDMIPTFALGSIVGFLNVTVATHNPLFSNVVEITAALICAFGARAFASIGPDQKHFCFGAIAQGSITLILPGYIVLCGSLELASKSITAGSTRIFYAVFFSLVLGYGMAVGAQTWLRIYPHAPNTPICPRTVDPRWTILLVPSYIAFQAIILKSRARQIPVQVVIGSAAYAVFYFVSKVAAVQIANTASALTLGVLGHIWARSQRAFAFAAVVAGIMVLVPSGLSAQGGLVAGLTAPLFNNGTMDAQAYYEKNIYASFSIGAQMITVAVGLTVGLFMSSLVAYPFGRKKNALFSF